MPLHERHKETHGGRLEKPPHEEIIELIDRRFEEILSELEEIKSMLRK